MLIFLITLGLAKRIETCQGVIFDAGSSGTRVFVYSWPCRTNPSENPLIRIGQAAPDKKINPGISAIEEANIEKYLQPLFDFASLHVDESAKHRTPILLGATAGMRLMTKKQQQAHMEAIRSILRKSGYFFQDEWARVLSGRDEGAYLWLSVQYLSGMFHPENIVNQTLNQSYATVDLGGASTQLASITRNVLPPKKDRYTSDFISNETDDEVDFTIYAHSWLYYGQDQANIAIDKLFQKDASSNGTYINYCFQKGFEKGLKIGGGDLEQCRSVIEQYLNNYDTSCDQPRCAINGVYAPKLVKHIYAGGAINNIRKLVNVTQEFHWTQLEPGYKQICESEFDSAKAATNPYYESQCFMGQYAIALLSKGYKISKSSTILTGAINNLEPSWTLAAIFDQLDDIESCPDGEECMINSYFQELHLNRKN